MDEKPDSQTNSYTPGPGRQTIVGTIVLVVSLKILEGLGVSLPKALFVSGVLDSVVTYWIPPRPRGPFHKYALTVVLLWLGVVVAFWPIPAMLRGLIPVELAYAIPAFFFTVSLYVVPLLQSGRRWHYQNTGKEIGLAKWIIGCAAFSLTVGVVVMILHAVGRLN